MWWCLGFAGAVETRDGVLTRGGREGLGVVGRDVEEGGRGCDIWNI